MWGTMYALTRVFKLGGAGISWDGKAEGLDVF